MLTVAESLSAGNKAMGDWKVADMTVGLAYLQSCRKKELDLEKRKQGVISGGAKLCPSDRLGTFEWASCLADIAYTKEESVIRKCLLEVSHTAKRTKKKSLRELDSPSS